MRVVASVCFTLALFASCTESAADHTSPLGGSVSSSCGAWRCGFNAAEINGRSLQSLHLQGLPNEDGVKVVGFLPPALGLLGNFSLTVENDEFVAPTVIDDGAVVRDGDVVFHCNFRADRARELTRAFVEPDFSGFTRARTPALAGFVCLTQYQKSIPAPVAYAPEDLSNVLGDWLAQHGRTQLRIAETEKYAHVTFFFSGGREPPYPGEERILIPSPKVATYDLQPQMSAPEVTDRLVEAIRARAFDLIVVNYANPDMVGHTGLYAAAVQAVEAIDAALGRLDAALAEVGGEMLVTADHGNVESMWDADSAQANTAHTTNVVPFLYVSHAGRRGTPAGTGALCDVAPTVLKLLNLPQPPEMTGRPLLALD